MMLAKILDTSFWDYGYDDTGRVITRFVNFDKMRTQVRGVIIRAGQNLWRDMAFTVSWANSRSAGLLRGSYWFYDSRINPKQQAQYWVDIMTETGDFGELPMFADFENLPGGIVGLYHGWKHWYDFLEELKRLVPEKEIAIYTAYYFWRENTLQKGITSTQLDYFKQYPLWVANYGVTKPLVPQPWTDWTFWQYTDKGDGVDYGLARQGADLNWYAGTEAEFTARFGSGELPNTDTVTNPFPGVKQIHGERFGRRVYVNVIDPTQVSIEVRNEDNFPSANCRKYGAQIAFNGDDWDRVTRKVKDNPSPSLLIFADRRISIGNHVTTTGEIHHSSGLRYLVQGGANVIPTTGTEQKYIERHARSVTGMDGSGKLVHLTVDGDYPDKGLTLYECAEIMLEFGAVTAFDQGGGGDSVEVLNGLVVSVPDDNVGDVRYERKVPQTILVYAKKEESVMNIKGVARLATNIKPMSGGNAIATLQIGDYVYGEWSSTKSDLIKFTRYYKANGTKIELGVPCKAYAQNLTISTEAEPTGTTPPPDPDPDPEPTTDTFAATIHDTKTGETWSGILTKQ